VDFVLAPHHQRRKRKIRGGGGGGWRISGFGGWWCPQLAPTKRD